VNKDQTYRDAVTLREEGRYEQAAQLFLEVSRSTDNFLKKAGMLLNVVNALKDAGDLEGARKHLVAASELLSLVPNARLGLSDEQNWRMLLIGVALEDARLVAKEGRSHEAIAKIDSLLTEHQYELTKPDFLEVYVAIQRDRAFLLADLGGCREALPILEQVDEKDPHDHWTLFYLGYCYLNLERYVEAQRKLEEAISLGLTPDFQGRAHCALGAACYHLQQYARAKSELEEGVKTASPRFLKKVEMWKWLEYTCIGLGLRAEAEKYALLARAS
jgi:tetratricopeptide (TPR) repeat protein